MLNSEDTGPLTPIRTSSSYPLWQNAARELATALEAIEGSAEALARHQRALDFLETFKSWTIASPPKDDQRVAIIAAMLDFNSQTRAFILNVAKR